MTAAIDNAFGLLIAYVVPGFTRLLVLGKGADVGHARNTLLQLARQVLFLDVFRVKTSGLETWVNE